MERLTPIQAATKFVKQKYPDCEAAMLGGSVVRGEATPTSDLDIIIIEGKITSAYRESLISYNWPIEVFVHNQQTIRDFFETDSQRGRPSLPRLVSEGIILTDKGIIPQLKEEADKILLEGPEKWSEDTMRLKRYFLTDLLDDFIGSENRGEGLFIAGNLAESMHEFFLRTNQQWIGSSKWILRALKQYDKAFADKYVQAFDEFYRNDTKQLVILLAEEVLEPFGGRLFEGFSIGK